MFGAKQVDEPKLEYTLSVSLYLRNNRVAGGALSLSQEIPCGALTLAELGAMLSRVAEAAK